MSRSTRLGRALALAATGGVAAGLAWLPVGGATAAVQNQFSAGGNVNAYYSGSTSGANCSLTSGSTGTNNTPITFSAGTKSQSASLSATFTSTANSADVTTVSGHYKGVLTVAKRHGNLASFLMGGRGYLNVDRALGSASECHVGGLMGTQSYTTFTESKAGWLYLNRTTGNKQAETFFVLVNEVTGDEPAFEVYDGGRSSANSRAWLTPGTYYIPEWLVGVSANGGFFLGAHAGTTARVPLANHMSGVFHKAGSALTAASGAGTAFVHFPGSLSCSTHSATLTWSARAGRVARASFLVNGKQVSSVTNPAAGHSVTLRDLPRRHGVRIRAELTLKGGAHAIARRAYVPCKG